MSVQQRLAKLERTQTGGSGAGALGVCRVDDATGTGPDVVTVAATGETLSKAAFQARYPLGLLVVRTEYGVSSGPERVGNGQGAGSCRASGGRPPSGV
jgi:hypothetical protein